MRNIRLMQSGYRVPGIIADRYWYIGYYFGSVL